MILLEPEYGWAIRKMSVNLHSSFSTIYEKIHKWMKRFPFSADHSVYNDLLFLVLQNSKQYLDQRHPSHLCRLILSMHLMQKKILRFLTLSPETRHLEIKWFQTELSFPFCSRKVQGLLIGFNVTDRYEIFDEENILLALQKYLPDLRLVRDSFYCHSSVSKNVKIFYLEIEKKYGELISKDELNLLKTNLEQKVIKSIQTLSPVVSMWQTQEETYKNIIVLSNEITCLNDIPQVYITFEKQTGQEIVFHIILVQISPFHAFSLKDRFLDCTYVSHRMITVKSLENHPVEAITFSLCLPRGPNFLRSDGSLDFYAARKKVVDLLNSAIGEFRDFNGGIIIKQQHQLQALINNCPKVEGDSAELLENFFFELSPLENQIAIPPEKLSIFFNFFMEQRKEKFANESQAIFRFKRQDDFLLLMVQTRDPSLMEIISKTLQEHPAEASVLVYNFLQTSEGLFFNCLIMEPNSPKMKNLISTFQACQEQWETKKKDTHTLTIGMEYSILSLDPRIGGDNLSSDVLRLLFEGLTRIGTNGSIENAVAKSVSVSPCSKHYTFHLRRSFWNDGSPVTAYDFEYAWKKILTPQFETSFASYFYPIKNAQAAKLGQCTLEEIGINAVNDFTLKVELVNPTPYFLQLTAHPLYSPIHHLIDQQHPQWPHQTEQHYPCNGPFQLLMNKPQQGFKLIKNSFYFDAQQIYLKEINITLMNASQAYKAFQKNELDWIGGPLGSWQPFFVPGKEDRVISLPKSWVCWTVFNTSSMPFYNSRLRQAIAHAVERSIITAGSLFPITPAYSPLLTQSRQHAKTSFPAYQPEIAKQLFDEALEELGFSANELPPIQLVFHEKGVHEYVAILLKQQLKDCLGLELELVPLPWKTLFNNFTTGKYQMGLTNWTSLVDDPIYTLSSFKSTLSNVNFSKWHSSQFEHLIHLSDQETNPYQRSYYLLEAEKLICQEMPIIPLFYQPSQALVKNKLNVLYKSPSGPFNMAGTTKTKNGDFIW